MSQATDGAAEGTADEPVEGDNSDVAVGASATSVSLNGAVPADQGAMARAASNIADWKTYLPENCVQTMMNAGWHWST